MKNEPYQSNELIDLKREALIKKDMETLRKINDYEHGEYENWYFIYEYGTDVYDRAGNMVDISDILPDWKTEINFFDIDIGRTVASQPSRPGALMSDIEMFHKKRYDRSSIVIQELPLGTSIPLPDGYNWGQHCIQQPVAEPDEIVLEIVGERIKLYLYWDKSGYKSLSRFKP